MVQDGTNGNGKHISVTIKVRHRCANTLCAIIEQCKCQNFNVLNLCLVTYFPRRRFFLQVGACMQICMMSLRCSDEWLVCALCGRRSADHSFASPHPPNDPRITDHLPRIPPPLPSKMIHNFLDHPFGRVDSPGAGEDNPKGPTTRGCDAYTHGIMQTQRRQTHTKQSNGNLG